MRTLIPCLLLLVFTSSCEENDQLEEFHSRLYQPTFKEFEAPRVFTRNGEMLDQSLVEEIVEAHNLSTNIFAFESAGTTNELSEEERFDLLINLKEQTGLVNGEELNYLENGDLLTFRERDTSTFITPIDLGFIFEHLIIHKPQFRTVELVQDPDFDRFQISELKEAYFIRDGNQLRFPTIDYHFHGGNSIGAAKGGPNNEVNTNVFQGLTGTDTLITQQSYLIYQ